MQQPRRFTASTLAEAYQQVRDALGGDAVILSTRKVAAPGLLGSITREVVEVVARAPGDADAAFTGMDMEGSRALHDFMRETAEHAAIGADEMATREGTGGMSLDPVAGHAMYATSSEEGPFRALASSMPVPAPTSTSATDAALPAATEAMLGTVAHRIEQMRSLVERLAAAQMDERASQIPALEGARARLVEQDVTPAVMASVLARVESMLTKDLSREAGLRALHRALVGALPAASVLPSAAGRRAIALVGPAGAGKTTLAMRMALDLREREGARVVVAATDVSRAGAPQQVEAMGAALDMPVRLCYTPADLAEVAADESFDTVIVDTNGHNGVRRDRMIELQAFLRALTSRYVLLVLPATMRGTDQRAVMDAFLPVAPNGLAVTRCDETSRFGATASVSIESGIGVTCSTHSDLVSEAPRSGDARTLASAVTTGRWASLAAVGRQSARSATDLAQAS